MRLEPSLGFLLAALAGCAAPTPSQTPAPQAAGQHVKAATDVPGPIVPAIEPSPPGDAASRTPGAAGTQSADTPTSATSPSTSATPSEPSRDLEVVARLVEPRSASHCGYFHWVVVMRYEVVRVVSGEYTSRDLFVAHSCPELLPTRCRDVGEQVRAYPAGDVHHLRLRRGEGDGTLVDKFTDKSLPRYRSRCTSLVEAAAPAGDPAGG